MSDGGDAALHAYREGTGFFFPDDSVPDARAPDAGGVEPDAQTPPPVIAFVADVETLGLPELWAARVDHPGDLTRLSAPATRTSLGLKQVEYTKDAHAVLALASLAAPNRHAVFMYDRATREVRRLGSADGDVERFRRSSDDRYVAIETADDVELLDVSGPEPIGLSLGLTLVPGRSLAALRFSQDASAALVNHAGGLALVELATAPSLTALDPGLAIEGAVHDGHFSPDGRHVVYLARDAATQQQDAFVFERQTGTTIRLSDPILDARAIRWVTNTRVHLVCGIAEQWCSHDLRGEAAIQRYDLDYVLWSVCGSRLIVRRGATLYVTEDDETSTRPLLELSQHAGTSLDTSSDCSVVSYVNGDDLIWMDLGPPSALSPGPEHPIALGLAGWRAPRVRISPLGTYVELETAERMRIVHRTTGTVVLDVAEVANIPRFAPDDSRIVFDAALAGTYQPAQAVLAGAAGTSAQPLPGHVRSLDAAAFSADGRYLAFYGEDAESRPNVYELDFTSGEQAGLLPSATMHSDGVRLPDDVDVPRAGRVFYGMLNERTEAAVYAVDAANLGTSVLQVDGARIPGHVSFVPSDSGEYLAYQQEGRFWVDRVRIEPSSNAALAGPFDLPGSDWTVESAAGRDEFLAWSRDHSLLTRLSAAGLLDQIAAMPPVLPLADGRLLYLVRDDPSSSVSRRGLFLAARASDRAPARPLSSSELDVSKFYASASGTGDVWFVANAALYAAALDGGEPAAKLASWGGGSPAPMVNERGFVFADGGQRLRLVRAGRRDTIEVGRNAACVALDATATRVLFVSMAASSDDGVSPELFVVNVDAQGRASAPMAVAGELPALPVTGACAITLEPEGRHAVVTLWSSGAARPTLLALDDEPPTARPLPPAQEPPTFDGHGRYLLYRPAQERSPYVISVDDPDRPQRIGPELHEGRSVSAAFWVN